MTTINGTISATANPGPALEAVIETQLSASGYTLVDTVTIGGNTHKVFKSAGASGGNTYGLDWFLDVNYPTAGTTGGIRLTPFETYNATTHVGGGGPYSTSSTTIDATQYNRFGSTQSALETNWANSTSYTALSSALVTVAFNYRISITRDRVIMLLTNNPNQIAYAGFYTPSSAASSYAGAALFPLVMAVFSTASTTVSSNATSSTACLTRLPKLTTMASSGWSFHVLIPTAPTYIGTQGEGQIGVGVSPFTGRTTFAPLRVWANSAGLNASTPSPASYYLDEIGSIDDVGIGYVAASSIRDDSVTVGSDTWYDATPNGFPATLFFRGV